MECLNIHSTTPDVENVEKVVDKRISAKEFSTVIHCKYIFIHLKMNIIPSEIILSVTLL